MSSNRDDLKEFQNLKEDIIKSYFDDMKSKKKSVWERINDLQFHIPLFRTVWAILCSAAWAAIFISYLSADYYSKIRYGRILYDKMIYGSLIGMVAGVITNYWDYYLLARTNFFFEMRDARMKNLISTWQFQKKNLYYNGWVLIFFFVLLMHCFYLKVALITTMLAMNMTLVIFNGALEELYDRLARGLRGEADEVSGTGALANDGKGGPESTPDGSGRNNITTAALACVAVLAVFTACWYGAHLISAPAGPLPGGYWVSADLAAKGFEAAPAAAPTENTAAGIAPAGTLAFAFSLFLMSACIAADIMFFGLIAWSMIIFHFSGRRRAGI